MLSLKNKIRHLPYLRWIEGVCVGLLLALVIYAIIRPSVPVQFIKVPEVKVIEKPVIVKKPVYLSSNDKQQIECLAKNAYFEAGNQSTSGKAAVTHVVLNRIKDERFPKTACGVVYQKSHGVCQFSWVCGGKKIHDMNLFAESKKIAENVYLGNIRDITRGAKFYHATYVHPHWNFQRVAVIGTHIFYRG